MGQAKLERFNANANNIGGVGGGGTSDSRRTRLRNKKDAKSPGVLKNDRTMWRKWAQSFRKFRPGGAV